MTLDVRSRLAEGAEAVAVQAQPVHDWYYAEDGLRLDALAADSRSLAAAAVMSEEAVRLQREALELLTEGWRGGSGYGAVDFVARHCGAATDVLAALRDGAAILTTLGANLERAVDAKVDAALRGDWAAAMRSPTESMAAYGEALTRLGELPAPRFETPLPPAARAGTAPALGTRTDPSGPIPVSQPASLPSPPPVPSWAPGLPGSGLPDIGGSLAGLITQIARALGPYSDSAPIDVPPDAPVSADSAAEAKPVVAEKQSPPDKPLTQDKPLTPDEPLTQDKPLAAPAPAPAPAPLAAEAPAQSGVAQPPEPAAPAADTATPCEIAADELPQVGR